VKLFVVIYDSADLLGHFLVHYKQAGIDQFFIATAKSLEPRIRNIAQGYDVEIFTDLVIDDWLGNSGNSAVTMMRERYQKPTEWSVICDLDEFIDFQPSLPEIIVGAEIEDANSVRGIMFDRFARNGQPRGFKAGDDLSKVYPVKARFMQQVGKGYDAKYVLVKGHLRALHHHHSFAAAKPYSKWLEIAHYKWREGSVDRLRRSCQTLEERGVSWRIVYQNMIDHYDQNGCFKWETFGGQLTSP
jgi:hypothetical protein